MSSPLPAAKATPRYAVRRFCPAGLRAACFEVYDTTTGECASFGMRKRDAVRTANAKNKAKRVAESKNT